MPSYSRCNPWYSTCRRYHLPNLDCFHFCNCWKKSRWFAFTVSLTSPSTKSCFSFVLSLIIMYCLLFTILWVEDYEIFWVDFSVRSRFNHSVILLYGIVCTLDLSVAGLRQENWQECNHVVDNYDGPQLENFKMWDFTS